MLHSPACDASRLDYIILPRPTHGRGRYTIASSHLISPEFVLASKVTTVAPPRPNSRVHTCVTASYLPNPVGSPRCRANSGVQWAWKLVAVGPSFVSVPARDGRDEHG